MMSAAVIRAVLSQVLLSKESLLLSDMSIRDRQDLQTQPGCFDLSKDSWSLMFGDVNQACLSGQQLEWALVTGARTAPSKVMHA